MAQGASGRNSGFVVATSQFPGRLDQGQLENYRRINRINRAGLELLNEQVSRHAIDCQWRRDGFYHTAIDRPALEEYDNFRSYLDTLQVEHEPIDKTVLQERLGSALYQAGIRINDGALVQPAALVYGLADTLPANVSLCEQSPVVGIEHGKPLMLKLENARVEADKVILATNYEAPTLGFLGSYIIGSTLAGSFTRKLTQAERDSLGSLQEWGAISLHSGGAR